MGEIKKVLYHKDIKKRKVEPKGIWSDLCENLHLHFKNYRFDFSTREWDKFCHNLFSIYNLSCKIAQKINYKEYKNGGSQTDTLTISTKNPYSHSDYYPDRFVIEWQQDNTFHIHYREFRLHLSEKEFDDIADGFIKAQKEKVKYKKPNLKLGNQIVPIDDIQPYGGHKCGAIDEEHRKGIEYCKKLLKQGKKVRPILVRPDGERMDGFKRYIAQKEMGFKEIKVIVDPNAKKGGQQGESLTIE